jgi:hypothetical protein
VNELVFLHGHTGCLRTARDGRLIVACVALVGDVVIRAINASASEFVPLSALAAAPHKWNTKPVVIDHPVDESGKQISANHSRILEAHGVGTIANAHIENRSLCAELHIDEVKAARVGAGRLLERLHAGDTLEVSVGCFVRTAPRSGTHGGKSYQEVWQHVEPDHIALLSAGIGACSVREHGCGASFARAAEFVPDPYAAAIAQARAACRPTFADQYRAARLAALAAEYASAVQPAAPPAVTDVSAFDPPNPYSAVMKEYR